MKKNISYLICLVFSLLLVGCGLPKESTERANALKVEIEAFAKTVETEKQSFDLWLASPEAKPFIATAKRESWNETYFVTSRAHLVSARNKYATEIETLLKRNSADDMSKLDAAHVTTSKEVTKAKSLIADYHKRKQVIEGLKVNSPKLLADSETALSGIKNRTKAFLLETEKGSKEFPEKKDELATASGTATTYANTAETAITQAKAEVNKGEPDYGLVANSLALFAGADKGSKDFIASQSKRIGTLSTSYSKTLIDMRIDYFASVTRVSWDESSDWDSEHNHVYPSVKIDAETAKVLDNPHWDENPAATANKGWTSANQVLVPENIWKSLQVDLWQERKFGDDMAEYYIDTESKYYHRYRVETNGKIEETGWIEVTEASFDSLEDYLGMSLVSKAIGRFEDETVKTPMPDGMEHVGNPAYGSWKSDGNGGSFWHWYGQYAFMRDMLGGHQYSRTEWDDWRTNYRGKKPYHGPADEERYGSGGSVTSGSGQYQKAEYYRANPGERSRSGGISGSHRGSGPSGRGGGPGGGGK